MAATCQAQKPKQEVGNWGAIFPTEQVTQNQSALFVKKLLAVAVSNITYLRAIFPENAFGDRCLEDLNLKILRDDSSCPGACQVIKWVKGCFDALDKKYLKILIIGIYTDPEDPDTAIESYTFKFSYTDDGGVDIYRNKDKISSAHTAAETKKATIRLLRTIVVLTQSLKSLPDDVMMSMKLLYFEDVTPTNYEPPGFTASENDSFHFEEEPMNIKVGDVSTPFHTVKLRIKTDAKQFDVSEEGEKQTEVMMKDVQSNADTKMEVEDEEIKGIDKADSRHSKNSGFPAEPTEADDAPTNTPAKPGVGEEATVLKNMQTPISLSGQEDMGVRCPCGCNEDDGLMILCHNCKFWQHGVCFMVTKEENAPEQHVCDLCGKPNDPDLHPTDPALHGLTEVEIQARCLWRRSLMACTEMTHVLVPNFARRLGVEMTVAQGLINRLEKEGYIKNPTKAKRLGKVTQKDKLIEGMKKYFKPVTKFSNEMMETNLDVPEVEVKVVSENATEEIEKLTSKTMDMDVSGKKKRGSKQKLSNKQCEVQRTEEMCDSSKPEASQRRGRKRAKPISDEDQEFEISNSQDHESQHCRKKRKASVARRPIMV